MALSDSGVAAVSEHMGSDSHFTAASHIGNNDHNVPLLVDTSSEDQAGLELSFCLLSAVTRHHPARGVFKSLTLTDCPN